MTEAARLVDELTTLLYEVVKRWQLQDGRVCEIVACGACRKKADKPESVVHESDCPVYRLIRAEEANTAVIRAKAEEIADLEDKRDELEAQVNALTAEIERERQAFIDLTDASVRRIDALTAERDELLIASRECRESMSRAMTAMARDVVTINALRAGLDALAAERDELRADVLRLIEVRDRAVDGAEHAFRERDAAVARAERAESVIRKALNDLDHGSLWDARAALAAASEAAQTTTEGV